MKEIITNEAIVVSVIAVIVAFFFGQSGIFNKWFDFIFNSKKAKEDKELANEIAKEEEERKRNEDIKTENVLLRQEVEKLRLEIYRLDKHIAENTIYIKTLLAWLEKSLPEGTNPFITEMANEIKKRNNFEL
jgi:uncharacterized protein YlxW (UPF0749 family)